jgi:DNA polymerase V
MQKQPVGLVDCNNFFVSCERLFRPDLAKRPVVVLSSNDGCVVARSQEIKDMGVPMGVPYFQIKDIIKDKSVAVFSSNFTLYRDLSQRVFSIVKEECKDFEQYSIDEAFFHAPVGDEENFARHLRDKIAREVGMPVSVGIAASKTLAKYSSRLAKKQGGVSVLPQTAWTALAPTVRLGELWGVGSGRVRAFSATNLHTAMDVMAADPARMAALFGVEGSRLRQELLGGEAYPVGVARGPQKSIMSSRSFKNAATSRAVVQDAVAYHVRRVAEDVRAIGMKAGMMTVFMGSSRFASEGYGRAVREIMLEPATDNVMELIKQAALAVDALYDSTVAYKKAGVLLGGFTTRTHSQLGLFGAPHESKQQLVQGALEKLNHTFGIDTVRVGSYLKEGHWQARRDALSPAYTTQWQSIPRVRA